MIWLPEDTWIVAIGAVTAMACALVGTFLVLRRLSLMGDAISHAVLPGLALGFILTGARSSGAMFAGAAVVGLLTALWTDGLTRAGRMDEGASMGVVFTTLFALGLVLIRRAVDRHGVDIDPNCVLYGALELAPLDRVRIAGLEVPRAFASGLGALVLNGAVIAVLFKEFRIAAFDPALATTVGIRAGFMHALHMSLVAVTTVAAFEAVGSILVVAMLIVPPATALLLARRLGVVLVLSLALAFLAAAGGHLAAITVPRLWGFQDTSTVGTMAVVSGALFGLAVLVAPHEGLVVKAIHRLGLGVQVAREDILGHLVRAAEAGAGPVPGPELIAAGSRAVGSAWVARRALGHLLRQGWVASEPDGIRLLDRGKAQGERIIRSHRLWETWFDRSLGLPLDHLHATSEQLEHVTTPGMLAQLAAETGEPARDPQGRPIPRGEDGPA